MKVFVSSTCYDLIDVRSEIAEHLRGLGAEPVMSDDNLSKFDLSDGLNSIETCLSNVRSCDHVIVILDRRYGPTLEKYGHPRISATHLEYQEARKSKKPILFFIRDRLDADFAVHKRNPSPDVKFSWVNSKHDERLFEFIKEHKNPSNEHSNWCDTFTSSIDLKAAVSSRLRIAISPTILLQKIAENKFPLLNVTVRSEIEVYQGVKQLTVRCVVQNVSESPAFNCLVTRRFDNQAMSNSQDLYKTPWNGIITGNISFPVVTPLPIQGSSYSSLDLKELIFKTFLLQFDFDSVYGIHVCEKYRVTASRAPSETDFTSGVILEKREFTLCEPLRLEIAASTG